MDVDTGAFVAALERLASRAGDVTHKAAADGAEIVAAATVAKLTEKSHPPGTKTPSAPGEPPAMISGHLMESVHTTAVDTTANRYEVSVGPTAVYARIQELGGTAGRGAQLPARPYLSPALEETRAAIGDLVTQAWRDMLH